MPRIKSTWQVHNICTCCRTLCSRKQYSSSGRSIRCLMFRPILMSDSKRIRTAATAGGLQARRQCSVMCPQASKFGLGTKEKRTSKSRQDTSTHYFDSFSKKTFVSSSDKGLILWESWHHTKIPGVWFHVRLQAVS